MFLNGRYWCLFTDWLLLECIHFFFCTEHELLQQRSELSMELLWVQQAIHSRKQVEHFDYILYITLITFFASPWLDFFASASLHSLHQLYYILYITFITFFTSPSLHLVYFHGCCCHRLTPVSGGKLYSRNLVDIFSIFTWERTAEGTATMPVTQTGECLLHELVSGQVQCLA